jgi:hypothetical protein
MRAIFESPPTEPIHAKELAALATGAESGAIELDLDDSVLDSTAKADLLKRLEENRRRARTRVRGRRLRSCHCLGRRVPADRGGAWPSLVSEHRDDVPCGR